MKTTFIFLLTGTFLSQSVLAKDPLIDLQAPELEKRVGAYLATTKELKSQFKVAEANVDACTKKYGARLKAELINPALKGLSEQEKTIRKTHDLFKKDVTKIQNGFSADGTTILQGGSFAMEKNLVAPVKSAAKNATDAISNERAALAANEEKIESSDFKIKTALTSGPFSGKEAKAACEKAKSSYLKSRELSKALGKRLAELEAGYQAQVAVAQAQADLLSAIASK